MRYATFTSPLRCQVMDSRSSPPRRRMQRLRRRKVAEGRRRRRRRRAARRPSRWRRSSRSPRRTRRSARRVRSTSPSAVARALFVARASLRKRIARFVRYIPAALFVLSHSRILSLSLSLPFAIKTLRPPSPFLSSSSSSSSSSSLLQTAQPGGKESDEAKARIGKESGPETCGQGEPGPREQVRKGEARE